MDGKEYVSITHICSLYNVEVSFISNLRELGLIDLKKQQDDFYIHFDHIPDVERMIRIHSELHINPEGIDVVFNLLEKVASLNEEMNSLKNRLKLYENDL